MKRMNEKRKLLTAVLFTAALFLLSALTVFASDTPFIGASLRGDFDGSGEINSADAVRLLRDVLLPDSYEMTQDGDVNGDGAVNTADAVYLLRHVLLPEQYPLSGGDTAEEESRQIAQTVGELLESAKSFGGVQIGFTFYQTLVYEDLTEELTEALGLGEEYTVIPDPYDYQMLFEKYKKSYSTIDFDLDFTVDGPKGGSADFTAPLVVSNVTANYIRDVIRDRLKGNPVWDGKINGEGEFSLELYGEFPDADFFTLLVIDALGLSGLPDGISAELTVDENEYYESLKEMYDEAEIGDEVDEFLDVGFSAASYYTPNSFKYNSAFCVDFIITKTEQPEEADPFDENGFCLVRDGAAAPIIISDGYSEALLSAVRTLSAEVYQLSGVRPMIVTDAESGMQVCGPKLLCGGTAYDRIDALGDSTFREYCLVENGEGSGELIAAGRTDGGDCDAVNAAAEALIKVGDDVYIASSALGITERELPETEHAFDRFWITAYGDPYRGMNVDQKLADEKILNDLVAFGVDEIMVTGTSNIAKDRQFINKLYQAGISCKLFCWPWPGNYDQTYELSASDGAIKAAIEAEVRRLVESYGDLDGVAEWGLCDEPKRICFEYLRFVKECFDKYDMKHRPVYINLDPWAMDSGKAVGGSEDIYAQIADWFGPDFYCYDRYPFFEVNGEPTMTDRYYYMNVELNRNYAIDNSRDAGDIVSCIMVGGHSDEGRADINEGHFKWETNLLLANGYRYIEYYVYYYVHDYCLLGPGNEPTWRWYLVQSRTPYIRRIGNHIGDMSLDAVFHLPNADGSYEFYGTPYYSYAGSGEIDGCDAMISFYDSKNGNGGELMITDKRCDAAHGGTHDVTLHSFGADTEWFDVTIGENGDWADISTLDAASVGENGLTITLEQSEQYLIRHK